MNLATVDRLNLHGGSQTNINNAGSFNVDKTVRDGGASIKFGSDVSKKDKHGILHGVEKDTRAEADKAFLSGNKKDSNEYRNGIRDTKAELMGIKKMVLLL